MLNEHLLQLFLVDDVECLLTEITISLFLNIEGVWGIA